MEHYLPPEKPENLITDYTECHFIESGVWVRKSMLEVFSKNGIPTHNLAGFLNAICKIVEDNFGFSAGKINNVDYPLLVNSLRALSHRADSPNLYDAALESAKNSGAELNFAVWRYFSLNLNWEKRIQCFADMPINYLEKYAVEVDVWEHWFQILMTEGFRSIVEALKQRDDVYGSENLPDDILTEILFGFNDSDISSMNRSYSGIASIASMVPFRLTEYYENSKHNNEDKSRYRHLAAPKDFRLTFR